MSIAPSSANADGAIDESQGQDRHQLALVFGREDAGIRASESRV
jgi:tRNA C32,U32 (ribose-2'-O)-methylase TrmJ